MPFCPSFEPWKKLTPVHVSTSKPRIQNGGGWFPLGASYSFFSFTIAFTSDSSKNASANPNIGESSSDFPIFAACAQSTPLVPDLVLISWLAMPTPMIEPISVCELDAGNPNHHVPRFHRIAAVNSANTIAKRSQTPRLRST